MKKFVSLALVLVMLLGIVPMAAATGVECIHAVTETKYEPNNDGTHWETVLCKAENCTATDNKVSDEMKDCTDGDLDGECDKCHAAMPDDEPSCEHTGETETAYTPNGDGSHTKTVTCKDCTATVSTEDLPCTDNGEGVCNLCGAAIAEGDAAMIVCGGDGLETLANSATMTFTLTGVEASDVTWSFSATGTADPRLSANSATGTSAMVDITAGNGRGVASVTATATWADGSESDTFNLSFYDIEAYTLRVKEGEKTFRFTQTGVFSGVSNIKSDKVEAFSLIRALSDGCADRVILSEDRNANAKVGVITYKTTGKFLQYDPEDYNDYDIGDLDNLTFTVLSEGKYKLDYELYEQVGRTGLTTTRGTLNIEVGDPGEADKDIVYRTSCDKAVSFDVQDFVDYWEDHARTKDEYLDYVKFSIDDKAEGLLYLDDTQRGIVVSSNKFVVDYKKSPNTYPLDGVTYKPDPKQENYTEEIDFVAYGDGDSDTVIRGTVTIIVGAEVPFTDVKKTDWFYKEVGYVYEEGIMNGTDSKTFSPNATLTRAMVVTMLYRVEGSPANAASGTFSDVAKGVWYEDAVEWASLNEIVNGVGNGKFDPDSPITREQLAAILYRYAQHERMDISPGGTDLSDFSDESKVSSYAESAMKWAVHAKIINGEGGKLNPKGSATRAQAAAMLYRFLEPEIEE